MTHALDRDSAQARIIALCGEAGRGGKWAELERWLTALVTRASWRPETRSNDLYWARLRLEQLKAARIEGDSFRVAMTACVGALDAAKNADDPEAELAHALRELEEAVR